MQLTPKSKYIVEIIQKNWKEIIREKEKDYEGIIEENKKILSSENYLDWVYNDPSSYSHIYYFNTTIKDYNKGVKPEFRKELKDLNTSNRVNGWSKHDDDILRKHYKEYPDKELAVRLGRTRIAILSRRKTLNLPKNKIKNDFLKDPKNYLKKYQRNID